MKVVLQADITKTGKALPVAKITDFDGTNLQPRKHAETALTLATELVANVRRTAMKDTPAGEWARKALEAFGIDADGDEPEEPGEGETEWTELQPAAKTTAAKSRG